MQVIRLFTLCGLLAAIPSVAAAQTVSVQGALGSNINGGGNSQSVSLGVSAGQRIDFLVSVERNHLPMEVTGSNNSVGVTRGGTVKFVSGEIRFAFFNPDRTSPYVLAGAGRGVSRPNVNEIFPNPVRNDATLFYAGGGVRIPVTDHLSVFVDVRFVIQAELDSAILLTPVRGGLAWRF